MYDNYRLNVEEKKMRGAGDRPGPGGFNMDRGDMNKRGSQVRTQSGSIRRRKKLSFVTKKRVYFLKASLIASCMLKLTQI